MSDHWDKLKNDALYRAFYEPITGSEGDDIDALSTIQEALDVVSLDGGGPEHATLPRRLSTVLDVLREACPRPDIVEALAKGVLACECEHMLHVCKVTDKEIPCIGPARHEHVTAYGRFAVCDVCHAMEHMPLKGAS